MRQFQFASEHGAVEPMADVGQPGFAGAEAVDDFQCQFQIVVVVRAFAGGEGAVEQQRVRLPAAEEALGLQRQAAGVGEVGDAPRRALQAIAEGRLAVLERDGGDLDIVERKSLERLESRFETQQAGMLVQVGATLGVLGTEYRDGLAWPQRRWNKPWTWSTW